MKALLDESKADRRDGELDPKQTSPAAEPQSHDLESLRGEVGRIARDLNDCLTSIQGFVSLARTNLEHGVVCREHLEQISIAVTEGAAIGRDLMRIEESEQIEDLPAPAPEFGQEPGDQGGATNETEEAEEMEGSSPEAAVELSEPTEEEIEAPSNDLEAPAAEDENPAPVAAEESPRPAPRERKGGNETILVVEDEEMVRDLVVRSLGYLGYQVIDACNGEEGLEVGRQRKDEIDMVFTDIVMPRMSGPEMVAKMSEADLGFPVLYTTGFTDNKRLLDNGEIRDGVNLLPKPYTTKVLASRIREVLDGISA